VSARPSRLPEVIADRIQDLLIAERLPPGSQLSTENELAERYEISRTVVREAARILEERGLVSIRPGRGMITVELDGAPIARHFALLLKASPVAFEQLMDARLLIETRVAGLAAMNRDEPDLIRLQSTVDGVRANRFDFDRCLAEDLRFHVDLCRASGNPMLSLLIDPINECLRETYTVESDYMSRLDETLTEHQAILDAVAAGDAGAAEAACAHHLDRIRAQSSALTQFRS